MEVNRPRFGPTSAVGRTSALTGAHIRPLPGGARIVERWSEAEQLTLTASGDIGASDQHAVIDLVTGAVLCGARRIHVDASRVTFADAAVLWSLVRCHRFLTRGGGTLTVTGLRAPFDLVWLLLRGGAQDQDSPARGDPPTRVIGATGITGEVCA